jgi:hypothetical protein
LFISDIRHKEEQEQFPSEECVWEDMEAQRRWVEMMRPSAAMLKFRLPWCEPECAEPKRIEYLDGELRLPVWGCPSTTETRLIVRGPALSVREWDCGVYERHMFFFNTVVRAKQYQVGSYDDAAEQAILRQYIQRCAPRQKPALLRQRILRELLTHSHRVLRLTAAGATPGCN